MLEVFLTCVTIVAFVRAIRQRHTWAILSAGAVLYLLVADLLGAAAAGAQGGVFGFFGLAFIGPGSSPLRLPAALPLPRQLLEHPILVRALRSVVCWIAAWICLRQSAQLNPLLPRAYALDDLASVLTGAGIIDAVAGVILLWAWFMLGGDAAYIPHG